MKIVDFSTRRRVTIFMFTVAVLVFGWVSGERLSVNLLPELSYPTITIRTELTGAAPQEIENLVTKPIEEAVGVIKGVRRVHSVSRTGQSDVTLEFAWGTDMDFAGVDVRDRLDVLALPLEAEKPVLLRFDPSSEPVLRYGFALNPEKVGDISAEDGLKQLRRYADEQLKKDLESIDGVAAVKISGGLEDEIQVLVDQNRLAQLQIPIEQVAARLRAENVNLSGGRLEEGNQEYLVRTINEFASVEEMQNAIIATREGRQVYLRDIATVQQGYKEREAITRINGKEAVEVALYKEGDANTVRVAESVESRVRTVKRKLPEQYALTKVYDQSIFISQAIDEVVSAAVLGGILAGLVIFFFLRNFWATVIISVSIPVSVIATFIMMYFNGVSLNIMSLGGIALAVGMLVDNAIVVLENIARHRGKGKDNVQAARDGTSEVGMAIFASTLTTIAVFFPLVFVQGIAGQLFSDQSLTVTFALAFSLIVALTLIPMLSAIQAKSTNVNPKEESHPVGGIWRSIMETDKGKDIPKLGFRGLGLVIASIFYGLANIVVFLFRTLGAILAFLFKYPVAGFNRFYQRLDDGYPNVIRWALHHRFLVLGSAFAAFAASLAAIPLLGVELIPQLSQGEYHAEVKLAAGAPLEETDAVMQRISDAAGKQERVATTYSVAGTGNRLDANPVDAGENSGKLNVVLKGGYGREGEEASMNELRRVLSTIPGVEYKFGRPELFSFDTPLEVEISGYDIEQLKLTSDELVRRMNNNDRFSDIKNTLQLGAPEIQIHFDHERAAQLGLNVSDIANRVVSKVRGDVATRYTWRDRKIDVLIRTQQDQRASVDKISRLIVNPQSTRPVPLSAVADIEVGVGPSEIRRAAQQRIALVTANLNHGDLGTAVEEINAILDDMAISPQLNAHVTGQSEDMNVAFESMQFALILAVFLVYLVMASQFESLLHPFVILFTIPLALTGAILALLMTGTTISVVVFIGLIMLAGIVVNNAIVLVDMINQLRLAGVEKLEAIVDAGHARLRPIIMTTLTTALGLLPMAIGLGEGSEIRTPMAITVIGGLLFSTLLTLVVIPVMYAAIDRKHVVPEGVTESQPQVN